LFAAGANTVPPKNPLNVPPIGDGSPQPLPGLPLPPPPPQPITIGCRPDASAVKMPWLRALPFTCE
jgi:hypothetical protein